MELRHIRYFVAVAEEKSFRKAAERLHLSQPPLSMQIRQFEAELGTPLFERTSRSVRLSAAGENLLPLARNILTGAERMKTEARRAAAGEIGTLAIGYLPSTLGPLLAETLHAFRVSCPNVQISLVEQRAPQQIEGLLDGTLDLGLVPGGARRSELSEDPFGEGQIALALPRDHRLASLSRIPLARLRGEKLILIRPELAFGVYDSFLAACAAASVALPVFQYTNDLVTKLWLVSAGFGISPTLLPWMDLPGGNVVYRPLAARLPKTRLYLLHRKSDRSPLIGRFVAHVRAATRRVPG